MESPRAILHLDLDAFFCAVEEIKNPELRGKPFAVGGDPRGRGVVSSCSYPARKFGVRSAMPMAQAVRICPDLIIVGGEHESYRFYSRKVIGILHQLTDQVEQLSIDEAFVNITSLNPKPEEIGSRLQARIRTQLDLPNSVGIAANKLVAKIATDVGKLSSSGDRPPNALTVVPPGEEARFLSPLPVDMLWGVGPKSKERLESLGITTIGDLAAYPVIELAQIFGKHGYQLSQRARGIDQRPLVMERDIKSVSNERTFRHDKERREEILGEINRLAQKVSRRLQKKELKGRTIQIKVRWSDFDTLTRQVTLGKAVQDAGTISKHCQELFELVWQDDRRVRLIGVGVSNLDNHPQQMRLWDPRVKKDLQLEETLQKLQEKYGDHSITRGFK
ncbi:MAG: DNA polymerase IV [Anaerolineales bacterium]|nr:DNA polymerase IV [Anaerolineales bacterium]